MINIQITQIPHSARSKYYKNVGSSYSTGSSGNSASSTTYSSVDNSYTDVTNETLKVNGVTQIDLLSANYIYIKDYITTGEIVLNNSVSKLVITNIRNNTNGTINIKNKVKVEVAGNLYQINELNIILYAGSTLIASIKPNSDIIMCNMLYSVIDGGSW